MKVALLMLHYSCAYTTVVSFLLYSFAIPYQGFSIKSLTVMRKKKIRTSAAIILSFPPGAVKKKELELVNTKTVYQSEKWKDLSVKLLRTG